MQNFSKRRNVQIRIDFEMKMADEECWVRDDAMHRVTLQVTSSCYEMDIDTLFVGASNGEVRLIDFGTKKLRRKFKGHNNAVAHIKWLPAARLIVSAGAERWDAAPRALPLTGLQGDLNVGPLHGEGSAPAVGAQGGDTQSALLRTTVVPHFHGV